MGDFIIGAGIKATSVVSYNHLGNNDGKNLSDPGTFRSKEISKASVLDDAIKSNKVLYPEAEPIDHIVVIKYCPFVGDSKRAMDEYSSQIFLNGSNTIVTYNICEDSLLAAPIMIDLVILAELFTRIQIDGKSLGPVLSYLSYFFKAPITNHPEYVLNSFNTQKTLLTNFLKACAGIVPDDATLMNIHF
jgi:myo-inositol-1-phosphate synthase